MDDHSCFSRVCDNGDRMVIHRNLLECRMIPSLYTFMENLKYLEPCVKILRSLLLPKDKRSVRKALFASYVRPTELQVEYGVHDSRPHPLSSVARDREIEYPELWLYALRNSVLPKQDASENSQLRGPDLLTLQRLGSLAVSRGFRTEAAEGLAAQDEEESLAAQLVNRAELDSAAAQNAIQKITQVLRNAQRRRSEPSRTTFRGEGWLPRERRCGRPFQEAHNLDRPGLFVPMMYAKLEHPSENISTLYCKREMFRGFLGAQNESQ